jgi:hypothetical protein
LRHLGLSFRESWSGMNSAAEIRVCFFYSQVRAQRWPRETNNLPARRSRSYKPIAGFNWMTKKLIAFAKCIVNLVTLYDFAASRTWRSK